MPYHHISNIGAIDKLCISTICYFVLDSYKYSGYIDVKRARKTENTPKKRKNGLDGKKGGSMRRVSRYNADRLQGLSE
jgi:hypothetical protein